MSGQVTAEGQQSNQHYSFKSIGIWCCYHYGSSEPINICFVARGHMYEIWQMSFNLKPAGNICNYILVTVCKKVKVSTSFRVCNNIDSKTWNTHECIWAGPQWGSTSRLPDRPLRWWLAQQDETRDYTGRWLWLPEKSPGRQYCRWPGAQAFHRTWLEGKKKNPICIRKGRSENVVVMKKQVEKYILLVVFPVYPVYAQWPTHNRLCNPRASIDVR